MCVSFNPAGVCVFVCLLEFENVCWPAGISPGFIFGWKSLPLERKSNSVPEAKGKNKFILL